ncbi:MAG: choline ABC transporter ATP-binding protein [Nitratireductor sp.]|nr:choline ABC transporter ATP-binding protein [Nitratireductor sp.]MCB1455589.1 choline ABC transporter ATP-binding protein [Nitratireductor sp.]
MTRTVVRFEAVDIVFGDKPQSALPLIDAGRTRSEIQTETGQILGVADCNLEVREGETLVLMGLSGSGKSTLLRAVNGLNPVIRGKVEVLSHDEWRNPQTCSEQQLREMRLSTVSMVFQQFGLLPWRTVEDNVGLGLEFAGTDRSEIRKRVGEQLELVGLSGWAGKRVQELSGGMQQRVGLARAFATQAPILLMDEPYSALDPLIRARLQDELIDLQTRLRRTIIFVSHDLDEAIKIGSRIAIMEGGRIVQCGTAKEILDNPASDYVADFVAHMNPLAVCVASDAMQPLTKRRKGEASAKAVDRDAPLKQVMELQMATSLPVYVEEAGKGIVGIITMEDVQRTLLR